MESGFTSWALEVIQKDCMHVWAVQLVYDEEADRGRPQVFDHLECDVLSYDSKM